MIGYKEGFDMKEEKILIVVYDIFDSKRWKKIFTILKGYGEWLQLSVFQCRMNEQKKQNLISELDEVINTKEDHVLFIEVGSVRAVKSKITSLGKSFNPVERKTFVF